MSKKKMQLGVEEKLAILIASSGRQGENYIFGSCEYGDVLARLVQDQVDWPCFLEIAKRCKLLPAARKAFFDAGVSNDLPQDIKVVLDFEYMLAQARFVKKEYDLCEILEALEARNIMPVVFKGIPLAKSLYDDPGTRISNDIDILVNSDEVDVAAAVLEECGYRIFSTLRSERFYKLYHFHYIFTRGESMDSVVELHWSLVDPKKKHRMDSRTLKNSAVQMEIMDRNIFTLSGTHCLWYLCVHLSYNSFFGLRNLVEIKRLAAGLELEQWGNLVEWSSACNTVNETTQALWLAEYLLGRFVPDEIRALMTPGILTRKFILSSYYPRGLVWGRVPFFDTHQIVIILFLRRGLKEKLRFAGHIVWPDDMTLNEIYFRKMREEGFDRVRYLINGLYVLVKVLAVSVFLGPFTRGRMLFEKLVYPERNI